MGSNWPRAQWPKTLLIESYMRKGIGIKTGWTKAMMDKGTQRAKYCWSFLRAKRIIHTIRLLMMKGQALWKGKCAAIYQEVDYQQLNQLLIPKSFDSLWKKQSNRQIATINEVGNKKYQARWGGGRWLTGENKSQKWHDFLTSAHQFFLFWTWNDMRLFNHLVFVLITLVDQAESATNHQANQK